MTVQEFVDKYNSFKNEDLKNKFVKERITTEYVSYRTKMDVCKRIVDATMQKTVEVQGVERKYFYSSAAIRFFMQQVQLIRLYTDIEIHEIGEESIDEFELLDKYALIDLLMCAMPEREVNYFSTIMQMYIDDYMVNENNIINYIENKLTASGLVVNTVLDQIKELADNEDIKKYIKSIKDKDNV